MRKFKPVSLKYVTEKYHYPFKKIKLKGSNLYVYKQNIGFAIMHSVLAFVWNFGIIGLYFTQYLVIYAIYWLVRVILDFIIDIFIRKKSTQPQFEQTQEEPTKADESKTT